jgi:hypothetical protein
LEEDATVVLNLSEIKGKTVYSTTINGKKGINYYNLDASEFHSGLYMFNLQEPHKNTYYKINILNH